MTIVLHGHGHTFRIVGLLVVDSVDSVDSGFANSTSASRCACIRELQNTFVLRRRGMHAIMATDTVSILQQEGNR